MYAVLLTNLKWSQILSSGKYKGNPCICKTKWSVGIYVYIRTILHFLCGFKDWVFRGPVFEKSLLLVFSFSGL